jgi:hypothetical protein
MYLNEAVNINRHDSSFLWLEIKTHVFQTPKELVDPAHAKQGL